MAAPAAGTPGLAVSLTDRRLTTTCGPGHTIYVFFDDQLVSQAQAVGHAFSDADALVPGDATTGWHHFELSCTDVDPWLASTLFHVVETANHPMGLDFWRAVDVGPTTWAKSAAISAVLLALILVYLIGFPAEWFNDTYDANEERMLAAVRRRFPRLVAAASATQGTDGTSETRDRRIVAAPLLFVGYVAVAALIFSFLDPSFGWSTSSFWLFLGWCGALAVVTVGFQIPAVLFAARTKYHVRFRVLMSSFVVAALCLLVSRLLSLEPGYCYGLIAVFAFRPVLPEKVSGRLAAVSSLFVLALSAAAWVAWVPIQQAASHPHPSPAVLVLHAALLQIFLLGIQSVSFGTLPLPFLPGRDIAAWNRWAWAGVFGLGLIAFVWTLLQPGAGFTQDVQHVDLIPVVATCAAFASLTLAFMAYFKFRGPKTPSEDEDAAPVGLVG